MQVNYDEVVQKLLENQKAMLLDNAILQVKADKLQQENETLKQQLEEKNRLLELKNTEIEKFQLKKWYQFWK